MTGAELLADLRDRGFSVEADDDRLLVSPRSRLTDDDRQRIRQVLHELLAALREPVHVLADAEAQPAPACAGCAAHGDKPGDRPHRLAPADADVAHAEPWDDAAIGRFQARVQRIRRRGFGEQDADDLAERLHLRDVHADHRALCLECRNLAGTAATGWRCGNHKAAAVMRELAAELVTTFQVCPGFSHAGHPASA